MMEVVGGCGGLVVCDGHGVLWGFGEQGGHGRCGGLVVCDWAWWAWGTW